MKLVISVLSGCLLLIPRSPKVETEPLPIEATLDSHSFYHRAMGASFSPDGQWIAYSVVRAPSRQPSDANSNYPCAPNWLLDGSAADVVVTEVASGVTKVVASGGSLNISPAWSPDGRYLAFASNRETHTRLEPWTWEARTGALRKVAEVDTFPRELQWTSDSRSLIAIGLGTSHGNGEKSECPTALAGRTISTSVSIYQSELTLQSRDKPASDPWNLDVLLDDLLRIDLDGRVKILDHGERVVNFRLSPDGSQVAFAVWKRFEQPGSQQILHDLNTIVLGTGKKSTLAQNIRLNFSSSFTWSPDSSQIAYQLDGELENRHEIYVVSAWNGAVRQINGFPVWKPKTLLSAPIWDRKGRSIYTVIDDAIWKTSPEGGKASRVGGVPGHSIVRLIAEDNGRLWTIDGGRCAAVVANDEAARQDGIYKIDLVTGQATALLQNGQRYWDLSVDGYVKAAPDGRYFLYSSQDAAQPIDLWIADENFSNPRRLTHINPQYDYYELGTKKFIQWLGLDGQRLNGVLLLPRGYEEGKRYPMIVFVYGGVSTQYNDFGFVNHAPINAVLLATRGFVVFMPDAPQHLGTPMLDLAKTVLPGINKVVEMGIADPKRLGLIGHSYGGYSVLSLLVQTPRFAAAVASAGTGNLISAYGQMNAQGAAFQTSIAEHGQGLMGMPPWEARDRYVENSPFFYLNRIETPLLIAHGGADTTVASFLSDETFVGMRRLGKETVYVKYPGEGHSPLSWSYANRLDFCSRVIAWFERYLK